MPFPPMEEVTQWTTLGIFRPSWTDEEKERLCVCRGGEGGEEGVQNPQGRAPENPREQKRIHIWQSFCLPWQLSVWRGAHNNELD